MADADVKITVRAVDKASKELKGVQKGLSGIKDAGDQARKGVDIAGTLSKVAIAAGTVSAALYTAKKAFDFAQEGAKLQQLEQSFDLMNQQVFKTPGLLDDMRASVRGTVDDATLMSGILTLAAGASDEVARAMAAAAPRLLEIAKASNKLNPALGDTTFLFESISKGIKRQSPLILDNLGLNIDLEQAYKEYAATLGKTSKELDANERVMATLNATMKAGDQLITQVGGNVDSAADDYAALGVEVKNLTAELKMLANDALGPAVKETNKLLRAQRETATIYEQVEKAIEDGWITQDRYNEVMKDASKITGTMDARLQQLVDEAEAAKKELRDYGDAVGYADQVLSNYVRTSDDAAAATAMTAEELEEAQANAAAYGEAMSGAAAAQRGYGESSFDASKGIRIMAELTAEYVSEANRLIDSIDDLEASEGGLAVTQNELAASFFETARAQAESADAQERYRLTGEEATSMVLGLGVALGELTEEQAAAIIRQIELQAAIDQVTAAFLSGAISADQAKDALYRVANGEAATAEEAINAIIEVDKLSDSLDGVSGYYEAEVVVDVDDSQLNTALAKLRELGAAVLGGGLAQAGKSSEQQAMKAAGLGEVKYNAPKVYNDADFRVPMGGPPMLAAFSPGDHVVAQKGGIERGGDTYMISIDARGAMPGMERQIEAAVDRALVRHGVEAQSRSRRL